MVKLLLRSGLFLILLLGGLPTHALAQAQTPRFEPVDCPFPLPAQTQVQCGYVNVPENRLDPGSGNVRLAVAVLKSLSPNPAPDPLIFLQGGPGGGSLGMLPAGGYAIFTPFLANRDVVLFDQRGTGISDPSLSCPEVEAYVEQTFGQNLSLAEQLSLVGPAIRPCRDRLKTAGIDLNQYNSAASAADVNDLRLALGYSQVNLLGTSYGTRLALTVLRDYPEGVRSVILDSSYPPQADLYLDGPGNLHQALEVLFNGCASDLWCRLAYPDLENVFYRTVERLSQSPATIQVTHPNTGVSTAVEFSGHHLVGILFDKLYSTQALTRLPALIYSVSEGDYSSLPALLEKSISNEAISIGMFFSVQCHEEAPFADLATVLAAHSLYPPALGEFAGRAVLYGETGLEICEQWGVEPAQNLENQPVDSEIPALVLAGQYDPVTPPAYGRMAVSHLGHSYFYEFPGVGHGVLAGGACPYAIMLSFLTNPTQAPNTTCITDMDSPSFMIRTEVARPWAGIAILALGGLMILVTTRGLSAWRQQRWPLAWKTSLNLVGWRLLAGAAVAQTLMLYFSSQASSQTSIPPLITARVVESLAPVFIAIQAAFALSPEDEPFMEASLSCPRPPSLLLLERLALVFGTQGALAVLVSLAAIMISIGPEGGLPAILAGLPISMLRWLAPAIFLAGMTICVTLITRRAVFGLSLTVLMWWAMAFLGDIAASRWPQLWPLSVYLQPESLPLMDYLLNRLFLILAGLNLIYVAIRQLADEERTLLGTRHPRRKTKPA